MTSGTIPLLYAAIQVFVEQFPSVPAPSFGLELPLAILDGFTRAYLLCSLIPPVVTAHTSPVINTSPWSLLVTSLVRHASLLHSSPLNELHRLPLTRGFSL
jgi:hypothetical protein